MRANKLETAVRSMPFCSGSPDFLSVGLGVVGGFITQERLHLSLKTEDSGSK